jgi:hypothetical protein
MKYILFFFMLLAMVFQLDLKAYSIFNPYVEPEYVHMAQKIRSDLAKKLSKRHGMRAVGTIGGMARCVNIIGLRFEMRGPQTKEKLREILVDCVEEFLQALNSDEKLRPHLRTYPFKAEGINIAILIVDATGEQMFDPEIGMAGISEEEITYTTTDPNDIFVYKSRIEEDYETALKIIKGGQQFN